ncbi:MAG TPA: hypothetical protein DDW23_06365 [Planctomycetes bacterium]|nr:hypothetical protein [Planctomycetota bacterium]|tara:strand:+ start:110 stop:994 length:885 start_codon:yes stop_codon:yes gene_type:complete
MFIAHILLLAIATPQASSLIATDSKCLNAANQSMNDNTVRAWTAAGAVHMDGLVKFDLSSIPDTAFLTSAVMRTYHKATNNSPWQTPMVTVYHYPDNAWARGNSDIHAGLGPALTSPPRANFPTTDLDPVDWTLDHTATFWSPALADDLVSLALHNDKTGISYVYFHGSNDPGAGSPEQRPTLTLSWTDGPNLTVTNLIADEYAIFEVAEATPTGPVIFAYSLRGGGPVTHPIYGTILLTPPFEQIGTAVLADGLGYVGITIRIPAAAAGVPVWFQAVDYSTSLLTNGVAEVVG